MTTTETELHTELYEVTIELSSITLYVQAVNKEEALSYADKWLTTADAMTYYEDLLVDADITVTTLTEMETLS